MMEADDGHPHTEPKDAGAAEAAATAAPDALEHTFNVKEALSLARDIVAIVGIFLFFTGFLFRYYYLLGLQGTTDTHDGTSLPEMAIYAYTVVWFHGTWVVIVVSIAAAASVAVARWPHLLQRLTLVRYGVVLIGVVAVFLLLDTAARTAADHAVVALRADTDPAVTTQILFTKEAEKRWLDSAGKHRSLVKHMFDTNVRPGLRIIARSDKGLVVLVQPAPVNVPATPGVPAHGVLGIGQLFSIPSSDYVGTMTHVPERSIAPIPETSNDAPPPR